MAMVISPRSKIVTLSLLIGIITVVAFIVTVIGIWHKSEKPGKTGTKVVSSKLQQITGYTATKHESDFPRRLIPSLEETAEGPLERGLVELGGGERDRGSFKTLVKTYPRTTELEIVGKDVPLVAETIPRGTLLLIIQTNLSRLVCC